MRANRTTMTIVLGGLIGLSAFAVGCSKFYWEKPDGSAAEFKQNERLCLQQATKDAYRNCMQAAGWARIKSLRPPADGYRGSPEEHGWAFRPEVPVVWSRIPGSPSADQAQLAQDQFMCMRDVPAPRIGPMRWVTFHQERAGQAQESETSRLFLACLESRGWRRE